MKLLMWMAWSGLSLKSSRRRDMNTWVALFGITLGVASLTVSMAVVDGFEQTMKRALVDMAGHLQVIKPPYEKVADTIEKIKSQEPRIIDHTSFSQVEGVIAHQGQVSGVVIRGVEPESVHRILNLKSRLVSGTVNLKSAAETAEALIGVGLARNYNLKLGDRFRVVVPQAHEVDPTHLKRKMQEFQVVGIMDFARNKFNERFMLADLTVVNTFKGGQEPIGVLLKTSDVDQAKAIGYRLGDLLGPSYWVTDWRDIEHNLFEAIQFERTVIFFVIFVIIIAAALVVAISLYIHVVRRYADIGLMKAIGMSGRKLMLLFGLQGLYLGAIGTAFGLILGLIFCMIFSWAEKTFGLLPGSVYQIDQLELSLRLQDVFAIVVATLLICLLASLAPARKGASLSAVEGLRNE